MFYLNRRHYSALLNWIKKEYDAFASSSQIRYLMQKKNLVQKVRKILAYSDAINRFTAGLLLYLTLLTKTI